MKIRYELTADDFVAFNRYVCENSPSIQRAKLLNLLITLLIVIGIVVGIPFIFPPDDPENFQWWHHAIGIAFAIGFCLFFHRRTFYRNIDKQARSLVTEGKGQGFLGDQEIEIDSEFIAERTTKNTAQHKWSGIETIATTDEYHFLFLSAMSGIVIPRNRVLEGNVEEFIGEAKKHWMKQQA